LVALADPTVKVVVSREGGRPRIAQVNGLPATHPRWLGRFRVDPEGDVVEVPEADGLYRNEGGGRFTPIGQEPGTFLDADGRPMDPARDWGLGVQFRDLDGDRAPDLVVSNDNGSPDRFWINTGRGTFRAIATDAVRHGSRSSMGLDVADVDRDGHFAILIVDMLARDPSVRRRHAGRGDPGGPGEPGWTPGRRPGEIGFLRPRVPAILSRMDSKQLALACRALADNKKAENLVVLDVRKLSTVTDFFVMATGTSEPHLRAIENEVLDGLRRDHDLKPVHTEGSAQSHWVVADFFDVIVHIMSADVRAHYDIEGLWADAPKVRPPAPRKMVAKAEEAVGAEPPVVAAKAGKAPKGSRARKTVPTA